MLLENILDRKALHSASAQHAKHALKSSTSGLPQGFPAPSRNAALRIPSPACFDFTQTISESNNRLSSIPTLSECAVHLELLEAVLVLRTKVLNSKALDRLFGINLLPRRSAQGPEEKWVRFVALAVIRFSLWWDSLSIILGKAKNVKTLDTEHLPPLDVLMIWHTFMLNPRYYSEAVKIHSCPYLADLEMPWESIHGIIDPIDRRYCLSESASTLFTSCTGLKVDLLDLLIETQTLSPSKDEILALFDAPSRADIRSLDVQLRFNPLNRDARLAQPMTGSLRSKYSPLSQLLAHVRADETASISAVMASLDRFAADRSVIGEIEHPFPLLQTRETKTRLFSLFKTAARDQDMSRVQTFGQLATLLKRTLYSRPEVFLSSSPKTSSRLINAIQWIILAYCSRYSSPISLEGSALRQSKYVELMGRHLWIRSPALISTLTQAQFRYKNFITLFVRYPQITLAPTPDIDLIWHTHQCSPMRYRTFAKIETGGTEIDHNDGLGQVTIDDARKRTGDLYKAEFGDEYELCFCWDCEAVREASEGLEAGDDAGLEKVVEEVARKVTFHREVEVARRKGKLT